MLNSLARILQLDDVERNHLFALAREQLPLKNNPILPSAALKLPVHQLIDAFVYYPAIVINSRWDILACNTAASLVFIEYTNPHGELPNLLKLVFNSPVQHSLVVNWQDHARRGLAAFRIGTQANVGERWFKEFVEEMCETSPEFRRWWSEHDVRGDHDSIKELNHPELGKLFFQPVTLSVSIDPELKIMVYLPLQETDTYFKLLRSIPENSAFAANNAV